MDYLRIFLIAGQFWVMADAAWGLFKMDNAKKLPKKMKRSASRWSALVLSVMLISSFCLTYLLVRPLLNGWLVAIQIMIMLTCKYLTREFHKRWDGPNKFGR